MPAAKDAPTVMMVCTESFSADLGKHGLFDGTEGQTILKANHPAVIAHPGFFRPVAEQA